MDAQTPLNRLLLHRYNTASDLYCEGALEECMDTCLLLLDEPELPRCINMMTLILVASTVASWYEADVYRSEAEAMWRAHRHMYPEGRDAELDEAMELIRDRLIELATALQWEWDELFASEDLEKEQVESDEEVDEVAHIVERLAVDGDKDVDMREA